MDEVEQQYQAMQRAAITAESNELMLRRRLEPYLDAEIKNRDDEIDELEARIEELEAELEPNKPDTEPDEPEPEANGPRHDGEGLRDPRSTARLYGPAAKEGAEDGS